MASLGRFSHSGGWAEVSRQGGSELPQGLLPGRFLQLVPVSGGVAVPTSPDSSSCGLLRIIWQPV